MISNQTHDDVLSGPLWLSRTHRDAFVFTLQMYFWSWLSQTTSEGGLSNWITMRLKHLFNPFCSHVLYTWRCAVTIGCTLMPGVNQRGFCTNKSCVFLSSWLILWYHETVRDVFNLGCYTMKISNHNTLICDWGDLFIYFIFKNITSCSYFIWALYMGLLYTRNYNNTYWILWFKN